MPGNQWGGSFEIQQEPGTDDDHSQCMDTDRGALLRQDLDETQLGWLRGPQDIKKDRYVDLGCIICKQKVFKWTIYCILIASLAIGLPILVSKKLLPKHKEPVIPPDEYAVALQKALLFFNAQRSGHLPKNNGVPWRGTSGMKDGSELSDVKDLVGGYYDGGDNIKYHFPMAFSLTLLSWSVIEYSYKYKAIGEYNHVRDIIRWGTDYLLKTFNSSASTIDHIYTQVGMALKVSTSPDDHFCWQRPEDMTYERPVQRSSSASDLGSEISAALAAASIVFLDDTAYSRKLIKAAKTMYKFANNNPQATYSLNNPIIEPFYNSTDFWDELIWGAAWMYYATGNYSYVSTATDPTLPENANAFSGSQKLSVFSWDNKLPGAELILTRLRIFLNPGYPYEEILSRYHSSTDLNMCSFLRRFGVFEWTRGGLILLKRPRPLQYAVNAAFLAKLYADYMNASNVPGWYCGPNFISVNDLRSFAASQVKYILGSNPKNISYVVGYGHAWPMHVHHRGASIPTDGKHYKCVEGRRWLHAKTKNPHNITGAMVAGPDHLDGFFDVRTNMNHTEPTLAGNAGLVAALVALTSSGGGVIDRNTIFSSVSPLNIDGHPPPPPWRP
ncbi:hypothetical protein J5N97_007094 [Dioscorea zingiberensis]|uniref:cellulase n=1 Tax=Dioscorea zingiberensis TaxID=325984 RepID=A0A9D5DB71_9LILI|nr:hypothetical protein J5N97_007094 [Dioscorea zingiberensis]